MISNKRQRLVSFVMALILFGASSYASAEIIDDITVHTDANGDIETIVKFTVPIQYVRHFPQGKSSFTSVYFNILNTVPADEWQDYESHRTPPSDLIQDITVTTRDRGTGPKVMINFYRPAVFTVTVGKTNQILLIHIKPVATQQKEESKPASGLPVGAAVPPVPMPIAVVPAIPKTPVAATQTTPAVSATTAAPATVAPTTTVPTTAAPTTAAPTTAAPTTAAPTTAAPTTAAPVAPSGNVTVPKVVLAPSSLKPVRIPLGGKDGLPIFPDIDQAGPQESTPTPGNPSLADRLKETNSQAAALMEKGGNAILAGQSFLAIDSFNKVLNLPANKYSQDAQLWIGIARERSGQLPKAILEFNTYLKLYPDGKSAKWVKDRLDRLKAAQPGLFTALEKPAVAPVKVQSTEFQYSEFGSLSMYYYTGASQNNTVTTGTTQSASSFSKTDQKSLMTNINMTARSYNNEYDNRLVFQDFYAANFLPGQRNNNRLGAAFYEMRDRIANYSVKIGRQSGYGGGVMGRFDGVSAGYGFTEGWRANVVTGQLSDFSLDAKPVFYGASVDFGTRSPLGGSVYVINQTVSGITDRRAVGGNLRYFDQGFNIMSNVDYDLQFKALNIFTVQGTSFGGSSGTDYNFLLDRRRSPILDIRNAVSGTAIPLSTLIQNGFTTEDLISLANQRTSASTLAQVGMTNHLNEKWLIGTDFTIAKTAGLPQSGGVFDPIVGCVATEGCVAAAPSTGNTWTISERMTGMGVFQPGDITNYNLSYTKGPLTKVTAFQVSNHSNLQEKWALDTTLHLSVQSDDTGGKAYDISPTVRATYQVRRNLMADTQLGIDWTKSSSSALQSSSTSWREFVSFGFRLDF